MTTYHTKFSINSALQLDGLTTEKLLRMALFYCKVLVQQYIKLPLTHVKQSILSHKQAACSSKNFKEIIFMVEAKSMKTANFIVLENFPLYSILANAYTICINTMCEIEYLGNYLLFINNEVKTDAS